MIKLVELNSATAARTFVSYCQSRRWQVSVVVIDPQRAEIYVDPNEAQAVQQALIDYLEDPTAEKYNAAAWSQSEAVAERQNLGLGSAWSNLRQQTGRVTQSIALLCVVIFLAQQIWPHQVFAGLKFFSPWQWQSADAWFSWRWLTPALLHFSAAHLMFNLLAWWLFAGRIELRLGPRFLLLFSLIAAVFSNTLQFLLMHDQFGGLSGVVYAVLGFAWLYGWRFQDPQLRLSHVDIVIAVVFLLLGFLDMLWVNTANWAHLAGLLTGLVVAAAIRRPDSTA